jgi:hypothetical protein
LTSLYIGEFSILTGNKKKHPKVLKYFLASSLKLSALRLKPYAYLIDATSSVLAVVFSTIADLDALLLFTI